MSWCLLPDVAGFSISVASEFWVLAWADSTIDKVIKNDANKVIAGLTKIQVSI